MLMKDAGEAIQRIFRWSTTCLLSKVRHDINEQVLIFLEHLAQVLIRNFWIAAPFLGSGHDIGEGLGDEFSKMRVFVSLFLCLAELLGTGDGFAGLEKLDKRVHCLVLKKRDIVLLGHGVESHG
jgi:hypothetical protein